MENAPANEVLEFWLGSSSGDAPSPEVRKRWWKKDPGFDAEVERRFGDLHRRACRGELDDWITAPRSCLALVIVLDQFSRNLHRGDPRSWASDTQAQALVTGALERGFDTQLGPFERLFLYMPLMHAEDLDLQHRCVERLKHLAETGPEEFRSIFDSNLGYAHQHRDIVQRFGRFPHRNQVLGRDSTTEEIAFLREPGSSF